MQPVLEDEHGVLTRVLSDVGCCIRIGGYRHLRQAESHRIMEQINFLRSDNEEDRDTDVA